MIMLCQITVCLVLIALGGFFSGSETGIYRLSRFRLRLGIEQNHRFSSLLAGLMEDAPGLVVSMLIGTNLANYLITSIVTFMLLKATTGGHYAELYATMIIAPVLFIFSEVIPKNIYYRHPDTLMPRFAPLLWFFHRLFTYSGAPALLRIISRTAARLLRLSTDDPAAITASRRSRIREIIAETRDEGLLTPTQNAIMNRLVNIPDIRIGSVMTPIARVIMLDVNSDKAALTDILREHPYTRLPVYENSRNHIIGSVNIYQAMTSDHDFKNLREFVRPIASFGAATGVIDAINRMRMKNHKIVLVGGRNGRKRRGKPRPAGIVTMKDLVEELTGELAQW